ncbi:hypothetical protein EDB84DRAFT_1447160 [Lactarius hengduanensis]|nr:hypothetical protein EDB84DRAFT_1447160 [Lactarius hengduanensis]
MSVLAQLAFVTGVSDQVQMVQKLGNASTSPCFTHGVMTSDTTASSSHLILGVHWLYAVALLLLVRQVELHGDKIFTLKQQKYRASEIVSPRASAGHEMSCGEVGNNYLGPAGSGH